MRYRTEAGFCPVSRTEEFSDPPTQRTTPASSSATGGLTVQNVEGAAHVEIGYLVRADLQGNGYATEAATACRDHARDVLRLDRLIAIINPANRPSQRVAEKLGLALERSATWNDQKVSIYAGAI
jgi:RimJ/RimL family protein N-acetyltransferase